MGGPTWNDLQTARPRPEPTPENSRFNELCALVFSSGPGRDLMDLMRARHIDRRLPPNAPDTALREANAVCGFILELGHARDRGNEMLAKPKPAAA